jgi:hypothetical protein
MSKSSVSNQNTAASKTESMVEVLYQKLGDRWFAFSLIDNEVFVGSITPEEIHAAEAASERLHRVSGNT